MSRKFGLTEESNVFALYFSDFSNKKFDPENGWPYEKNEWFLNLPKIK